LDSLVFGNEVIDVLFRLGFDNALFDCFVVFVEHVDHLVYSCDYILLAGLQRQWLVFSSLVRGRCTLCFVTIDVAVAIVEYVIDFVLEVIVHLEVDVVVPVLVLESLGLILHCAQKQVELIDFFLEVFIILFHLRNLSLTFLVVVVKFVFESLSTIGLKGIDIFLDTRNVERSLFFELPEVSTKLVQVG
jgi:hypothetical protein